jgi:uncharacterized protein
MDRMEQYSIPFAGLAKGSHQFEFEIDDRFFEMFEHSVIQKATIHVAVDLLKEETMLTLMFRFTGTITLDCDRCLEEVNLPVNETRVMMVRFSSSGKADEHNDDVVFISHGEHHLNIAQHMYDFLTLMVPIRVVHPDDESGDPGCNPEFLKNIQEHPVNDKTDPRWEALKNLKLRKN